MRTHSHRYLIHVDGSERLWQIDGDREVDVSAEITHQPILVEHRRLLLQRILQQEQPQPRTWPY